MDAPSPAAADVPSSGRPELPPAPGNRLGWPWVVPASQGADHSIPSGLWPRITVVVPSYNQGEYIEETLRSVLLQDYPNLELMVLDGGSRDSTVEVLERYDPWLDYWVSEQDRGQTHAINKGLERASGEIFTYLNSDDMLEAGALHKMARAFEAHPEVDVFHGECVYVDEVGRELYTRRGVVRGFADYLRIWERLARNEFLTQPEVFSRTELIRSVGGFREELRSVMDLDMWLKLLAAGAVFRPLNARIARFRTLPGQKSAVDPGYELCRVVEEHSRTDSPELTEEYRRRLRAELQVTQAHLLVRAGIAATMVGRYRQAVRYCLEAVRWEPKIAGTYPFWAILGAPLKRVLPVRAVTAIRRSMNPPAA